MIKIIATLCSLVTGQCHDETITTSDFADLTMTGCLVGMPEIANWMKQHPGQRLAGWRCTIGGAKEHA